jgi:hypothetical protein
LLSQKRVMMFALAGIVALVLGIATGRALDSASEPTTVEPAR